jgi:hypothetical protein
MLADRRVREAEVASGGGEAAELDDAAEAAQGIQAIHGGIIHDPSKMI